MRRLLLPLTALFFLLVALRNWLYDMGLLKSKKVNRPVICIGNLSVGGTGKTPWVQWVSQHFIKKSKKVIILSRGYTGDFSGVLRVEATMDPRRCGDEPLWLKNNIDGEVYAGKDRFQSAHIALQDGAVDLFVLDDGFQHRALQRDLDLVLIDASASIWHESLLPMGFLREPFSALKRAGVVVINKCNYAAPEKVDRIRQKVAQFTDVNCIFLSDFVFSRVEPLIDGLAAELKGEPVAVSCGVGNPAAFLATLRQQNFVIKKTFIFPDHHYWKPDDIERMTYQMKQNLCAHLVITEKDAVKLNRYNKHFKEMGIQLWVCKMKVALRDREGELIQALDNLLLP